MNFYFRRTFLLFSLLFIAIFLRAQKTDTYTSFTTWTVPAGISTVTIKVYGGAGGTGGQDCGAGCTNTAAGQVGFVVASYSVIPGDIIRIYPGGNGINGSNSVTASGGGNGGVASYSAAYNGGKGGNAGSSGSSGGGGGGGGASVVTINSTIVIVAGGASGGGGMANLAASGMAGNSTTSANGTSNSGGIGTTPGGDGGGGGGGGGGQFGSVGGGVHAAGGESAGNGGFRGDNSVSGASSITTNASITWASSGQIQIDHAFALPVSWLSFSANGQTNGVALSWSTASEENTKDFKVQHSLNGVDWNDIGTVPAAGNSSTVREYSFMDHDPLTGLNYYRLLQRDVDGNFNYSKVVQVKFFGAERSLRVYPNPVVNGELTINLNQNSVVQVYSIVGVKLLQKEFSAGEHLLNVSQLSRGTYYLKAKNEAVMFIIQ